MNEIKKCFGKGSGWIFALNRWSVQERADISLCPITLQVLIWLAKKLCKQIAACILSRLKPFLLVWGVRKGFNLGFQSGVGGGVILGQRPKIYTWLSGYILFYASSSIAPFFRDPLGDAEMSCASVLHAKRLVDVHNTNPMQLKAQCVCELQIMLCVCVCVIVRADVLCVSLPGKMRLRF